MTDPTSERGLVWLRPRRRTWRWLVVLRDLPPMPPYAEVVTGSLTRRRAEKEAQALRLAHRYYAARSQVRIDVERAGHAGRKGPTDGR